MPHLVLQPTSPSAWRGMTLPARPVALATCHRSRLRERVSPVVVAGRQRHATRDVHEEASRGNVAFRCRNVRLHCLVCEVSAKRGEPHWRHCGQTARIAPHDPQVGTQVSSPETAALTRHVWGNRGKSASRGRPRIPSRTNERCAPILDQPITSSSRSAIRWTHRSAIRYDSAGASEPV